MNGGFWRETFGIRGEGKPVGLELGLELGLDDGVGLGQRVLARRDLRMWVAGGRSPEGLDRIVVVVHRHWFLIMSNQRHIYENFYH